MTTVSSPDKNSKKNKLRENKNAIKFAQEFFMIRIEGLIRNIHPSVSDIIKTISSTKYIFIEFELYRMQIILRHETNKNISDIVDLDYMEEKWTLRVNLLSPIVVNGWRQETNLLELNDSLKNILQLLSQESIKELATCNLQKISSLDDKIKENDRTIQWYKSENEKHTSDSVKLNLDIAKKMKELYETFRHRPSENKSRKSIPTGEEGIPKT